MKRRSVLQFVAAAAAGAVAPAGGTPEDLTRLIVKERTKYAAIIKRAGVKPE